MEDRILHPSEFSCLTPEQVRAWAYDEFSIISQEDQGCLQNLESMPLLIELAADQNCPKQRIAVAALWTFSQSKLLNRVSIDTGRLAEDARATQFSEAPLVAKWREWYRWLYERLVDPMSVSPDEAQRIASLLSIGDHCPGDCARTGRIYNGYTEFLTTGTSRRLYVYINEKTGVWQHRLNDPWDDDAERERNRIVRPKWTMSRAHYVLFLQWVMTTISQIALQAAMIPILPAWCFPSRYELIIWGVTALMCPFLVAAWTTEFNFVRRVIFFLISGLLACGTIQAVLPFVQ